MTYHCEYRQLFNVFGAPGIPNTYEAVLLRNGKVVERKTFWWVAKAKNQCREWREKYGAAIRPAS